MMRRLAAGGIVARVPVVKERKRALAATPPGSRAAAGGSPSWSSAIHERGIKRTAADLRGRHLLTLNDYTADEIAYLTDLAAELKADKHEGQEERALTGKQIALIFEKDSTWTRCAFEVAAKDQGAHVTAISPARPQVGHEETVKDFARVLGRMYDAIEYCGFGDSIVNELAAWSGVPVYNGLTAESHPTQLLADFLTFDEHLDKPLDEVTFCYLGDARFNAAEAYLLVGAKLRMDVRIASPRSLWPPRDVLDAARRTAKLSGGRITVTDEVEQAVAGCDVLLTDAWVATGESAEVTGDRISLLRPYQVNARTMALTGNPDIKFMHCLPAVHSTDTTVGKELSIKYGLDGLEVTDEVFESSASLVFEEAENRVHAIKAVLVATLGG
jgi:ornithine carbamoyltransferase